jgi:hypothetical protein
MLHSTRSFNSFKKILATNSLNSRADPLIDPLAHGELYLESRLHDNLCQLGLESEKSRLTGKVVKSSIDSDYKKGESNSSVPLS